MSGGPLLWGFELLVKATPPERLAEALSLCTPRERQALELRRTGATLRAVGQEMGITGPAVRALTVSAVARIRRVTGWSVRAMKAEGR